MKSLPVLLGSLASIVLVIGSSGAIAADAAGAAGKDPLKENGLTKVGNSYVVAEEAPVLAGMKTLRATKVEADKEVKARLVIDNQIAAKQKVLKDGEKQWKELEARLPAIQKPDIKNNIILRMNRLVTESKQASLALKDLEEQAGKLSISAKTKYVDELIALNGKVAAANAKYAAVASDAGVKAAIAKANVVANPKLALGPSPEFVAVVDDLKKWQGAVESEAIALREEHGIFVADVLLNGTQFKMGVDTGSSSVAIPWEIAEQLKMIPGEQDPTVHMKLANGAIIEGKEMTLTTVRVGRFTVPNVRCIVLEKGLPDPPLLLGGSFLNHFIFKLDPSKSELHLTEIKQSGAAPAAVPAPAGDKPPAAAGTSTK